MDALVMFAATNDPTVWSEALNWTWMIGSVAVGLGFVIFVHELGHFLVAKACGVKCEKFYIGFDLFNLRLARFKWGETEYGIGILPLGGYVKMLGQDDDPRQAALEAERCRVPARSESDAARAQSLAEGTAAEGLAGAATVEGQPHCELDPRSYPAKSVPARMAIISAGVIMNVIFGVLLAAWAYGLGVPETPAKIGVTVAGTPAWTNNLAPGTKIVAFGKDGARYDHYRFEDVKRNIIFNGADRDLTLTVVSPEGEERTVSVRPALRAADKTEFPTIGFLPPYEPKLGIAKEIPAHWRAETDVELADGDRIIAINGVELQSGEVYDPRLDSILARHPSGPLKLKIERKTGEESEAKNPEILDVVVQPKPMRDVGVVMKMGPVTAVRAGSPAERAGFQPGDVILKVDGQAAGDPMSLGQRLIPPAGEETVYTFVVARAGDNGKAREVELTVTPQRPSQYHQPYELGGPMAIESIGVAYDVTAEVAHVEAESAAAKELQPGDRVISARFAAAGPREIKQEEQFLGDEIHKEIKLDGDVNSWTRIYALLQHVLPDTDLWLKVKRGERTFDVKLDVADSKSYFDERRGLALYPLQVTHRAKSVGEAFYLGGREVKERMSEVLATISQLVSRRVSPKHLSGPLGIIGAAGHFASRGLPTLLIFLTILSANLAVLNFLPIPVLDGGHMLFLAWEGITRKPVNPNVQGYLSLAGLLLLLSLMIFATAMDFNRFFS